jgi:hypothetical protein
VSQSPNDIVQAIPATFERRANAALDRMMNDADALPEPNILHDDERERAGFDKDNDAEPYDGLS